MRVVGHHQALRGSSWLLVSRSNRIVLVVYGRSKCVGMWGTRTQILEDLLRESSVLEWVCVTTGLTTEFAVAPVPVG